jgi:LysM repeat protein
MNPLEETVRRLSRRLWMERILFVFVLTGGAGAWAYPALFPSVWAAYVDGKPVVAMRERAAIQTAVEQVKREEAEATPAATFTQRVRIDRADPRRVTLADARTAVERLKSALQVCGPRGVIYVDDLSVAALPDAAQANAVLEQVKASFAARLDELDGPPSFKEKVEVRQEPAEQEAWADEETALALLRGENGDGNAHTVAAGESAWTIARKYQKSLEELKKLNPGVNLDLIHDGQTLTVGAAEPPLVTVVTEGRLTRTRATPYRTLIRHTPDMYLGKQFAGQIGRPGQEKLVSRVRCENGEVVREEVLSRTVLSKPRDRVVWAGSKPRPPRK